MAKRRLDALLVDRGLAPDLGKAQAMVMAGAVSVDECPTQKAGTLVDEDVALRLVERARYVGRGGEKLEHALEEFGVDVLGLAVADIGASTGGFTDCLLQRGAARVYAIDSGKGQLDFRLRNDPHVVVMEGLNARTLESLPERVDLVTIDVSFISLRLVLPAVARLFRGDRRGGEALAKTAASDSIVALFKPQFEARKDEVPRGGVIRDVQFHAQLIGRFVAWCVKSDLRVLDMTLSPIAGADGNREFFFLLRQATSLAPAGASLPHDGKSVRHTQSKSRQ
ncbi:MAG: TlyA family RNA methyltransferase [Chloroflexi bacterium]|nr:MAG: TlyA family RNA methyltransferase [Chloroflexota bacterium]